MAQNFDPNTFDPNQIPDFPIYDPAKQPRRTYAWHEAWTEALLRPSVETFTLLVRDPAASMERALSWIAGGYLIGGIFSIAAQVLVGAVTNELLQNYGNFYTQPQGFSNNGAFTGLQLVCGVPIIVFVGIIFSLIIFGIVHLTARAFGGSGDFDKTVYGMATFYAPFLIMNGLLSFIPLFGLCVAVFLLLYNLVLATMVVRAVHNLGWGEAAVSAVSPILLVLFFCCGCVGLLAVLGANA